MNTSQSADGLTDTMAEYPSKQYGVQKPLLPKKPSPSNPRFLTDLKGFSIDKSKYRHYGHQLLMNAQLLDNIINKDQPEKTAPVAEHLTLPATLEPLSTGLVSWDPTNRILIDDRIADILGIAPQTVHLKAIWPYTGETLNEILRFRTEQERTKQEALKHDVSTAVIELLRLARLMNISPDLIPYLFVDSDASADVLHEKSRRLTAAPDETVAHLHQHQANDKKRKLLHLTLPLFDETAHAIRHPSRAELPIRLPLKLPVPAPASVPTLLHRRVVSDDSIRLGSPLLKPLGLPPGPLRHHLPRHQPAMAPVSRQPEYPVYYTPVEKPDDPKPGLGLPYAQKYQPVVFQTPGQAPHHHYHAVSGQYPPPYPYFAPLPPSNPPRAPPHQYVMPPVQAYPAPYQLPEQHDRPAGGSVVKFGRREDEAPPKKQKPAAKNSSINFMISTPKNPPAKKYNNTHRDKSGP